MDALRQVGVETFFGDSLHAASGLMLMGGTDVSPARYGASRDPETDDPDEAHEQRESALIEQALERDLPILAICRGMQMLNVNHGGTLVQHLNNVERHRQRPEDKSLNAHLIEITPGTELARIAGSELRREVNSRHHQAIACVGGALVVAVEIL